MRQIIFAFHALFMLIGVAKQSPWLYVYVCQGNGAKAQDQELGNKMSTSTQSRTNRATENGAAQSAATVTIEIAGTDVTLPVKFGPGHTLTDSQAKVLDAAYQRQFANNQNAMAKSRAENLTKATTDADRAKYAALSATQLAALYADYEPSVGGSRMGSMDKIRNDAAWRMWTALVTEHNTSVMNGNSPVIVKAGTKQVQLPSGKGAAEKREALTTALLGLPAYADRIQVQIDAIMAERGARKDAPPAAEAVISGDDLL